MYTVKGTVGSVVIYQGFSSLDVACEFAREAVRRRAPGSRTKLVVEGWQFYMTYDSNQPNHITLGV